MDRPDATCDMQVNYAGVSTLVNGYGNYTFGVNLF